MSPEWEPVGGVSPRALVESRLVLHHAAQLVAAVGRSLVPPRPDDGHTSLEWLGEEQALGGEPVPGPRSWRAALRADELVLAVLDDTGARALPLAGRTRAEASAWLEREAKAAEPSGPLRFEAPYTIPASPVGEGAVFPAGKDAARSELVRWFANADRLLRTVSGAWPGGAPVRVWPHHFDVGSVLPLGGGAREETPTIGIGMSPGDEGIAEPYFYATVWPQPLGRRPALPVGRWHTEGWTGALLTASDVVAAGDGAAQSGLAARFLSEAVACLRAWKRGDAS
jgi:hypothetical protein